MPGHQTIPVPGGVDLHAWIDGVPLEDAARRQLENVARLPVVRPHVAVMPDVHWGLGATVGSVIPTVQAIIPAAVGVDLGCGMMATCTSLVAADLPESLKGLRRAIEKAVPHGRDKGGGRGDKGSWSDPPRPVQKAWGTLATELDEIASRHPAVGRANSLIHLGTLGTGNHFIELCLDEQDRVWVMLHSGSRGVGNRIGTWFIEKAKEDMGVHLRALPDHDLAYLREGTRLFDDYVQAVDWAQRFAQANRALMMEATLDAIRRTRGIRQFQARVQVVDCHHNYVQREHHHGQELWLTRKGAVSARRGELGIIPGSMGTRSYIVRGKGNAESFHSCSHGAGRAMSRNEAKRRFSLDDHVQATAGIECRKDEEVLDETPGAYKDIDAVMAAQQDLVEVVHTLRQVLCVKG